MDVANRSEIAGWACNTESENPESVDILTDDRKIERITASAFSSDLHEYRNGYAAFHFTPAHHVDFRSHTIEIRFSNSGALLNNGRVELGKEPQAPTVQASVPDAASNPWNSDKPYSYQNSWLGARRYTDHINGQITGENGRHWFGYAIAKYILNSETEGKRCLLLGSNEGYMELDLCKKGFLGEIVATDIADKALQRAAEKIRGLGYKNVRHVHADLNHHKFDEKFDFIIAEGVLHHIENLEYCVDNLHDCLNDGG